jgi:hypothetical protein
MKKLLEDTYRADNEVMEGCIAFPLPFAAGALLLTLLLPLPLTLAANISSAVAITRGTGFAGLGISKFALFKFWKLLMKGLINERGTYSGLSRRRLPRLVGSASTLLLGRARESEVWGIVGRLRGAGSNCFWWGDVEEAEEVNERGAVLILIVADSWKILSIVDSVQRHIYNLKRLLTGVDGTTWSGDGRPEGAGSDWIWEGHAGGDDADVDKRCAGLILLVAGSWKNINTRRKYKRLLTGANGMAWTSRAVFDDEEWRGRDSDAAFGGVAI